MNLWYVEMVLLTATKLDKDILVCVKVVQGFSQASQTLGCVGL